MYEGQRTEIRTQASQLALRACWSQWIALGSMASGSSSRAAESIVDPEALILLSLRLAPEERRLGDLLAWWADVGSGLTSLQRLRAVAERFPAKSGSEAFGDFARLAADAGDRRWEGHGRPAAAQTPRRSKGPPALTLLRPGTLWLRLRAGLGVGSKADALTFLLGLRGARSSAKVVSEAIGYSDVSVRKALGEMALARFVRETKSRPVEYSALSRSWATLLEFHSPAHGLGGDPEVPPWRYWSEIFAFLAHVMEWSQRFEAPGSVEGGARVAASSARDILEEYRRPFAFNDVPVPDPRRFPGTEAIAGLAETIAVLERWIPTHL